MVRPPVLPPSVIVSPVLENCRATSLDFEPLRCNSPDAEFSTSAKAFTGRLLFAICLCYLWWIVDYNRTSHRPASRCKRRVLDAKDDGFTASFRLIVAAMGSVRNELVENDLGRLLVPGFRKLAQLVDDPIHPLDRDVFSDCRLEAVL